MKIQIRRSVFETNSSSTHSLQIAKQTLSEAKQYVKQRIEETYSKNNYVDDIFPEDYIKDNKFIINGFDIADGDEDKNVYYIITNWIMKLQYLSMYIFNYCHYLPDYPKEASRSYYNDDNSLVTDKLQNTEFGKWFIEKIKEYAAAHQIQINEVVWDICHDTYIEYCRGVADPLPGYGEFDVDKMKTLIETVMDDDYILTYEDEAYSPYDRPVIVEL